MVNCPLVQLQKPVGAKVLPLLPEWGQEMGPFLAFVRHCSRLESGPIQGINIYIIATTRHFGFLVWTNGN